LPDEVKDKEWYEPGNIGRESKLWERLEAIKEAYAKAQKK